MPGISRRYALLPEEIDFVKRWVAFGETNSADAYRRSHLKQGRRGEWHEVTADGTLAEIIPARECSRRGKHLLNQEHVKDFISEVKGNTGDHARQLLGDTTLFGSEQQAFRAATKVIDDEDKLAFGDAVERHAEVLCAIGTEVVVDLPGGGEVCVSLGELLPQWKEAVPPVDAIQKTIRTLEQWVEREQQDTD
jgi:hypothetical protein